MDEQALIAYMAYVDLNPIRAGLAEIPESSDYTSIQERIYKAMVKTSCDLLTFQDNTADEQQSKAIPFDLNEYI